jgi:hypothetical protein
MKLFIPKAWIDHIAWGHDNTLVGGILVCINLHTFLLPNIDPKWLFELTNAKKTRVFIFVMCRYGYYEKRTKQSKTEHESMKRFKSRSREGFHKIGSIFELKVPNLPLKNQHLSRLILGINFQTWQHWSLWIQKIHLWSLSYFCYTNQQQTVQIQFQSTTQAHFYINTTQPTT